LIKMFTSNLSLPSDCCGRSLAPAPTGAFVRPSPRRPTTSTRAFSGGTPTHTTTIERGGRGSRASMSGLDAPTQKEEFSWLDSLRQTFWSQRRQHQPSWEEDDDDLSGLAQMPPVHSTAHRDPYTSHLFERVALEPRKK